VGARTRRGAARLGNRGRGGAVGGQSKGLIVGSALGGGVGLVVGVTLAALFWNDVAAAVRKLTRRLARRDEQINFEILLQ